MKYSRDWEWENIFTFTIDNSYKRQKSDDRPIIQELWNTTQKKNANSNVNYHAQIRKIFKIFKKTAEGGRRPRNLEDRRSNSQLKQQAIRTNRN